MRNMRPSRKQNPWYQAFGVRLRTAIARAGLTQSEVARQLGLDRSVVTHWIKDSQAPEPALLPDLARILGTTFEALLLGDDVPSRANPDAQHLGGFIHISRTTRQIGAGPGFVDPLDDPKDYAFAAEWLKRMGISNPQEHDPRLGVYKVAKTFGDSMEPTIRPGAVLLADLGPRGKGHQRVESGHIYVLKQPGEGGLQVKRAAVKPRGEQLVIWGDNRSYPPETISLEGRSLPEVVVGRVRWIGHEEE